jgi:uncharacterized membrane protein YkvI
MNERDYKLFEVLSLLFGIGTTTIMFIFAVSFGYDKHTGVFIFTFLPILCGMFFATVFHVIRKEYIHEMFNYIKGNRNE